MSLTAFHSAPFTTVIPTVPHIVSNLLHLVHISNIHPVCSNYSLPFSLALLTFNCLFSRNSLYWILPFLSALSYSPPLSLIDPFPYSALHCLSPDSIPFIHILLFIPSFASRSLPHSPLITYMTHHIRLPPGLQEAGVKNQPGVARPDHPSPSHLRVTFDGPETPGIFFYQEEDEKFLLFFNFIEV